MKNALRTTLSCAAIAVLASGCIKPVAKTNMSSAAPLGTSAPVDVGYADRSTPGWLAQGTTVKTRAPSLMPAVPEPRVEKVRYLGNAPHICSPSGFGRMSTCFSRS
jgi:hypothetical protein